MMKNLLTLLILCCTFAISTYAQDDATPQNDRESDQEYEFDFDSQELQQQLEKLNFNEIWESFGQNMEQFGQSFEDFGIDSEDLKIDGQDGTIIINGEVYNLGDQLGAMEGTWKEMMEKFSDDDFMNQFQDTMNDMMKLFEDMSIDMQEDFNGIQRDFPSKSKEKEKIIKL